MAPGGLFVSVRMLHVTPETYSDMSIQTTLSLHDGEFNKNIKNNMFKHVKNNMFLAS